MEGKKCVFKFSEKGPRNHKFCQSMKTYKHHCNIDITKYMSFNLTLILLLMLHWNWKTSFTREFCSRDRKNLKNTVTVKITIVLSVLKFRHLKKWVHTNFHGEKQETYIIWTVWLFLRVGYKLCSEYLYFCFAQWHSCLNHMWTFSET